MSITPTPEEIQTVLTEADLLWSAADVENALNKMANDITDKLSSKNPLILCLMSGAVVPMGILLPKLNFPLDIDYVHVSRYQNQTSGGNMNWTRKPQGNIKNRCVLIIDDILDEGITLKAVVDECKTMNASEIYTAVLADKQLGRSRAMESADFTGLPVPNRYVFGYGMDYKGYLRNAPGIYAVKGL